MTPKASKDPSVITYLEMTEQPTSPPPVPAAKLALLSLGGTSTMDQIRRLTSMWIAAARVP